MECNFALCVYNSGAQVKASSIAQGMLFSRFRAGVQKSTFKVSAQMAQMSHPLTPIGQSKPRGHAFHQLDKEVYPWHGKSWQGWREKKSKKIYNPHYCRYVLPHWIPMICSHIIWQGKKKRQTWSSEVKQHLGSHTAPGVRPGTWAIWIPLGEL